MAKKARWIQIHEDLWANAPDIGHDRIETAACKRIADMETDLREMRRRAEVAESLLETTVEDCRREGVSMGRALANAAATKARARVEVLEQAVRTYLAAVDEESGQAIALHELRKALEASDV